MGRAKARHHQITCAERPTGPSGTGVGGFAMPYDTSRDVEITNTYFSGHAAVILPTLKRSISAILRRVNLQLWRSISLFWVV